MLSKNRDYKKKPKSKLQHLTSAEYAKKWCANANKKAEKYLVVKKSGIHNKGVFAKKTIRKGTKIIEYTGQLVNKEESDKRQERDAKNGTVYVFTLNKKFDIDGFIGGGHAMLINHHCEPNCETEEDNGRIWIKAIKTIRKGEELGYDYCFDEDTYKEHPCKCGAAKCRKFIIGDDAWKRLRKRQNMLEKNC